MTLYALTCLTVQTQLESLRPWPIKFPLLFLLTLARFSTRKSPWPAQALKVMSLALTVVAFTALCRLTNGFYLFFFNFIMHAPPH